MRQLNSLRPWDNRGKHYMDRKKIQTPRSMYPSIFNRLRAIADIGRKSQLFPTPLHLTPPYGVALGTIMVNVTLLERGFNACKMPHVYIHLSSTVSQ